MLVSCYNIRHYRIIRNMETDNHRRLGELLREKRNALGLTLENVSAKIQARGEKLSPQHLSNIENAYSRPGKDPATPPDDLLISLAYALDIPIRDLHAALGRVPAGSPASQLIHEQIAEYNATDALPSEQVEELGKDVAEYARWRVGRVMRQSQSQAQALTSGNQFQKQKQEAA